MLDRLRRTLVESFVGAIALGYLFAETILSFASIFSVPVGTWAERKSFRELLGHTSKSGHFPFEAAAPGLVRFLVLLVVWYVLFRWLYFTRIGKDHSGLPTSAARDVQS